MHFDLGVYANRRESLGQGTAENGVLRPAHRALVEMAPRP